MFLNKFGGKEAFLAAAAVAAFLPSLINASSMTTRTADLYRTTDTTFATHTNRYTDPVTAINNFTRLHQQLHCQQATSSTRFRLYVTILIFVFVVGLLGNLLAVTVILASRSLRRQWTNIFVASLNFCDIGVILCVLPFRISGYLYDMEFCFDLHACRFFNLADILFLTSSISHLFVMAIERFIAVRVPFLYQRIFNRSLTFKIIAATWLYAVAWTVASAFQWGTLFESSSFVTEQYNSKRRCIIKNENFFFTVYTVVYIVPLAVMAVLYSLILRTALEQQKMIKSLAPAYLRQDQDPATQKRQQQEVSASRTVAVIYGAFTVCLLPMVVISIISQVCIQCMLQFKSDYPTLADAVFTLFIVVLPAIHSCLNPFIYIIFHRRFRSALKALLRGKFKTLTEQSFRKGSKSNSIPGTVEHSL